MSRQMTERTVGQDAAAQPQVFSSATHVLVPVARHDELLAFERFRDHIGCWPTCAIYEDNLLATCDCGFDIVNHLNGETGWGATWPVNDEARAIGARLAVMMRQNGLSFEGWATKRDARHAAARAEIRTMTKRMSEIVREHQDQWVRTVRLEDERSATHSVRPSSSERDNG